MYKLYAFFDLEQLDSETLEKCMLFLPEERKAKVLRYRREIDRKLSVVSYLLLNLVCEVEDEFGVEIPDRIIGTFKTVGDVMDYISK